MYDVVIIGGGPAGLSAAIYSIRFNLKTLVFAAEIGGLIAKSHLVENWPGIKAISGYDLGVQLEEHYKSFNGELKYEQVKEIKKIDGGFKLTADGGEIETKTVIIATGSDVRKLGIPGEKEFYSKGVSYCATCDAAFFKEKTVAIIGGSDSAATEALLLAKYAKKVYIIYRKDKLRAEPINRQRVEKNEKIELIYNTNITEVKANEEGKKVGSVVLDKEYNNSNELPLDGIFIAIGHIPNNYLPIELGVELAENGRVNVDSGCRTNVKGIFAAGDITNQDYDQAITAAADGVKAAFSANEHLGHESFNY
jgi:thioredoxin reductase (NADPH)